MDVTNENTSKHDWYTETCNALADALGICKFAFTETYAILPPDLAEGVRALGLNLSLKELFQVKDKEFKPERMYNVQRYEPQIHIT